MNQLYVMDGIYADYPEYIIMHINGEYLGGHHVYKLQLPEKQTDLSEFCTDSIKCKGATQSEERYKEMLQHYNRGAGALDLFKFLDWPEIQNWNNDDKFAVFDLFIDWAYDNEHLN